MGTLQHPVHRNGTTTRRVGDIRHPLLSHVQQQLHEEHGRDDITSTLSPVLLAIVRGLCRSRGRVCTGGRAPTPTEDAPAPRGRGLLAGEHAATGSGVLREGGTGGLDVWVFAVAVPEGVEGDDLLGDAGDEGHAHVEPCHEAYDVLWGLEVGFLLAV